VPTVRHFERSSLVEPVEVSVNNRAAMQAALEKEGVVFGDRATSAVSLAERRKR
jgi:hypothetical protein